MTEPLSAEELHKRETDRLESRLWANDDGPSLAGYRQLAFDAISLLKDSTYAAREAEAAASVRAEAPAAAEQRLDGLREALRGLVDAHRLGREHRPCMCAAHEDARRALLDPAPELVARTEEMLAALRGPASPRQGEPGPAEGEAGPGLRARLATSTTTAEPP